SAEPRVPAAAADPFPARAPRPSRLPKKLPEGQADALAFDIRLPGHAVDVVPLAGPAHHEQGAMAELEVVPPAVASSAWLDDETPGGAEGDDRHQRVGSQLRLVIGVQPHAVITAPVPVQEDVVERAAGLGADPREEPGRRGRERPRFEG